MSLRIESIYLRSRLGAVQILVCEWMPCDRMHFVRGLDNAWKFFINELRTNEWDLFITVVCTIVRFIEGLRQLNDCSQHSIRYIVQCYLVEKVFAVPQIY